MEWPAYLMGFARHAAKKSKDKQTKVGAVAVGQSNEIVEVGFNGLPRGVEDKPERLERPAKYPWTAHAEANLVYTAARHRLAGTTVYVTHMCCNQCAIALIQAGVKKVVYDSGETSMPKELFEIAKQMFKEAGVEFEPLSLNSEDAIGIINKGEGNG